MAGAKYKIGKYSIVKTKNIGKGTRVWNYVNIMNNVKIGENVSICDNCFIESGVTIGDNVTIKNNVSLWDGVVIEDGVFVGPGVVFTNDSRPRSKIKTKYVKTTIKRGASLGAGSVILCGSTIGEESMIGAGSVVTGGVPKRGLCYGNPARLYGEVNGKGNTVKRYRQGRKLK